MNAEIKQIARASELSHEGWVYCGEGKWSDPKTNIKYHESVAIKIMTQRKAMKNMFKSLLKPAKRPLIHSSNWRKLATEIRKQLKPHGLTLKLRTRRDWGGSLTVEVAKIPPPKPVKCPDCGLMSDDNRCCANDEELWK